MRESAMPARSPSRTSVYKCGVCGAGYTSRAPVAGQIDCNDKAASVHPGVHPGGNWVIYPGQPAKCSGTLSYGYDYRYQGRGSTRSAPAWRDSGEAASD